MKQRYVSRIKIRQGICFLCVCLLFVLLMQQATASVVFQLQYRTDLAFADEDWWDRGVQYGRILSLRTASRESENVLLATHCMLNAGLEESAPHYPIYRSVDGGRNWEIISYVTDTMTGANSEWNPHLFELEKPCGNYPSGTVVLAACSVDAEHKTESHIRLYFSLDGGYNFEQGVIVASGGGLDNGVWEPFLLQLEDGRLVCYYSDDSDPVHSQKIVYKVSSDAENWGEAVDVVASNVAAERPGMPVVTKLGDGSYFMVYEVVDKTSVSGNPVCFRRSQDGLDWGDAAFIGEEITSNKGKKALGSAPYCDWTPIGGKQGTLVVSGTFMRIGDSDTGTDLFISHDYGKTWTTVPHLIPYVADDHVGYSNSFAFSADGKIMYAINNPQNPENPEKSKMVIAVAELQETDFVQQNNGLVYVITAAIVLLFILLIVKNCFSKKKETTAK